MTTKLPTSLRSALYLSACAALAFIPAQAALVFTIEAPGVQQSSVPGVTTENFDDGNLTSAIGTYTGGSVFGADVYGGAGGTGSYLFATSGNPSTLTFSTPQSYFGVWWSAGDAGNSLKVYNQNDVLIGDYVVGSIIPLLSAAYYGNPNGGGNAGEPYAYLNFTANGTDFISKVVFGGSNFESDNHSVTEERITPPGKPPGASVPDSGSTLAMAGFVFLGLGGIRRLLRKSR